MFCLQDAFVKVCLLNKDGKKYKKRKTSTQKYTMNPVYNEEISFTNISKDQLFELDIKLIIFHDSMTSRELLGYVELGSLSKGNEYEHWKDMIDGKKSIGWWHELKFYTYIHKNSIANVISHYHHMHQQPQQQQQQQNQQANQQANQQQSSNDDIEDVCDNNANNIIFKNLNGATIAIASLVLSPTQQLSSFSNPQTLNIVNNTMSPFEKRANLEKK